MNILPIILPHFLLFLVVALGNMCVCVYTYVYHTQAKIYDSLIPVIDMLVFLFLCNYVPPFLP